MKSSDRSSYLIRDKYIPLFNDIMASLLQLIDDFDENQNGQIIINSMDFFHIHGYLWNDREKFNDFDDFRNYWVFDALHKGLADDNYKLVVSRATLLEICDSIFHEIERLGDVQTNQKVFSDARKKFLDLQRESLTATPYTFDYAQKLQYFKSIIPSFSIRSNLDNLIDLFQSKKLIPYYDVIPVEDIKKIRDDINNFSATIESWGHQHKIRKPHNKNDFDDRQMHERIDCRNFSTAKIIGDKFENVNSYFVTPNQGYQMSELRGIRRSINSVALKIKAMSESGGFIPILRRIIIFF